VCCWLCVVLLRWLGVADNVIERACAGGSVISELELPADHDTISCAILDDSVDIHLVRPMFSTAAWPALVALCQDKKENQVWMCAVCFHDLAEEDTALLCDACLMWYHLRCCGLNSVPKKKHWFCGQCLTAASSR